MKRYAKGLGALVLAGMMILSGCGGSGGTTPATSAASSSAAPAAGGTAASPEFTLRVGHVLPTSHQTHITLEEVFKKEVEEKSGGKIKVEIYPNAQLGGDRKQVESVQIGALEMCVPAGSVVTGFDPEWTVLDMPFLFKDKEQALKNLDGKMGEMLTESLKSKGIVNLGFGENGLRHVFSNERPLEKLEDMKGLKIRTLESPMQVGAFKAMGAAPTPIAFNELFTALQQKTVDAAECPINIIYSNKFYEVTKYLSKTGHIYLTCPYLMNKAFFDKLPADLQEVVVQAVKDTVKAQREGLAKDEVINTKKIEESGMKINELSPEAHQQFVDAMKDVYQQYEKDYGRKYLDVLQ